MIKDALSSSILYLVCIILMMLYSGIIYTIGHKFWPESAKGSLIFDNQGQIRGSMLIAQELDQKLYFSPRPINGYEKFCNLALYNDEIKSLLLDRHENSANEEIYDMSLFSPSASLMDPYIMKRDAIKQALKIAKNRNMDPVILFNIIEKHSLDNVEPFFDLEIVNTTILNASMMGYILDIDKN